MRSLFALFLGVTTIACSPAPEASSSEEAVEKPTLTIYSGRSESLVGPIFDKLEAEGKFKLQVQYGDTAEMVTRLITEGSESPADLIFAQDSGHLGVLAAKDLLTNGYIGDIIDRDHVGSARRRGLLEPEREDAVAIVD